jgi:hypothetical protein
MGSTEPPFWYRLTPEAAVFGLWHFAPAKNQPTACGLAYGRAIVTRPDFPLDAHPAFICLTCKRAADEHDDPPARNGFAAHLIARNAADGAARKEPTMTEPIDHETLAQQIRYVAVALDDGNLNSVDIGDPIARDLLNRYELTPRTRPTVQRIGELVARTKCDMRNDTAGGDNFLRLLAEDGFEIRRIEGGQE